MCKLFGVAALLIAGFVVVDFAQTGVPSTEEGHQLFLTYCASCHGNSARGDGPAALAMRVPPANLTELAKRNGAVFPTERARRIIDGREVGAHGDPNMPVWGDAFSRCERLYEAAVAARGAAKVPHLASLQVWVPSRK